MQEEADRPRNQRWLVKKGKQRIKGGVPHNWSKSVSLNKLTWAEATVRTRSRAKRLFCPKLLLDSQFQLTSQPFKEEVHCSHAC